MPARLPPPLRVLLVDGSASLRGGMRSLLQGHPDLEVVGDAGTRMEALACIARRHPDVVVVGVAGDDAPLRLFAALRDDAGGLSKLLVVTPSSDPTLHYRLLSGGALGIVPKEHLVESLAAAVREVAAGRAAIDAALLARVLECAGGSGARMPSADQGLADSERLTRREREIAGLVVRGFRNRRIAQQLFVSEGTVRNHLTVIFRKLGLAHRCDLIAHCRMPQA